MCKYTYLVRPVIVDHPGFFQKIFQCVFCVPEQLLYLTSIFSTKGAIEKLRLNGRTVYNHYISPMILSLDFLFHIWNANSTIPNLLCLLLRCGIRLINNPVQIETVISTIDISMEYSHCVHL